MARTRYEAATTSGGTGRGGPGAGTGAAAAYRFDADTAVRQCPGGGLTARIGTGWNSIGDNPNGGYLLAVALNAAGPAAGEGQPLSATAHYLRPGRAGPADIDVEVVKRGRLTTTVSAALSQEGRQRLRVLATYGDLAALPGPTLWTVERPDIPGPAGCALPAGTGGPVTGDATGASGAGGAVTGGASGAAPSIAGRFDYRVVPPSRWAGTEPRGTALLDGWIRFADGRPPDVAALPLLADAFPAAIYEVVAPTTAAPTLELTVHVRRPPAPGWTQVRFRTRALVGGLFEEDGLLWDSSGDLVAMSRQLALAVPMG